MAPQPPLIDIPEPRDQRVANLVAAFEREYGRKPEGIAEAPGRVNLIGEHVDYNDGLVLPFAIDRTVICAWARDDAGLRAYSVDADEHAASVDASGPWKAYFFGTARALDVSDARLATAIAGDVPQGAGLSSSAGLEISVAGALRDALSLDIDDVALAKLCQRAENEYVGVQCGIMDQFASTLSKRDHALLIDCRTLAYRRIPLRLKAAGLAIVIANSAAPRTLASSAYNDRVRECADAVALLRSYLTRPDLTSLRDVTLTELEQVTSRDAPPLRLTERGPGGQAPLRRARHVVTEIARAAAAVDALERDDFAALGQLMIESHLSLRDDYEVSSEQLDLLVGLATAQDYVLGARLTGAGFGGCIVNLVRADALDAFAGDVIAPYRERTGLGAVMYVTPACDGLRTWRL